MLTYGYNVGKVNLPQILGEHIQDTCICKLQSCGLKVMEIAMD